MTPDARFQRWCRLLRLACLMVLFGLAGLLLLAAFSLPSLHMTGLPDGVSRRALMLVAVQSLPAIGYLWALWASQRALGDLATGRMFQPTVARAMRHMGIGVLAGALLNVFAVTNLARMILGGRGSYLNFDLSGIVLGVVGAALILLAHVVDQARAMQAELDEIV